jgi:hypothetical protein
MGTTRPGKSSADIAGVLFGLALFSTFLAVPIGTAAPPPEPPVIDLVVASRTSLFGSQSTELFCVAHQVDDLPLTYSWSSTAGTLVPSGDSALWFAPETGGDYSIEVLVQDDAGSQATDGVIISVRENSPPEVTAISALPAEVLPGESTALRCVAADPEGQALSFEWMAPSGELSGIGGEVGWTAPSRPGTHRVAVLVTDELGAARVATVAIEVSCPEPPEIRELLVWPTMPDYTTEDIHGGYRLLRGSLTECEVECVASVSSGPLVYQWSCTDGAITGEGPIVLFTPPNATAEVDVTVKVSNVCGQWTEAEVLFRVFQREEYPVETESMPGCLRCLYGY